MEERQWRKIFAVLDEKARATADTSHPYFQGGEVCKIGNDLVHNKQHCHDTVSLSKGCALLRVRQPRRNTVIVNNKCKTIARRMAHIFATTLLLRPLRPAPLAKGIAAADAFGEGDKLGIGVGSIQTNGRHKPHKP